jgi:hypothetical protein
MLGESMDFSMDCQTAYIFCQRNPNMGTLTPVRSVVDQSSICRHSGSDPRFDLALARSSWITDNPEVESQLPTTGRWTH